MDEKKILPGQDFDLEIKRAIRSTDAIIVVLSKNSVSKEGYIQKELKLALDALAEKPEGDIFLIPALLEECHIPEKLRYLHYVDLRQVDSGKKLLAALDARALSKEKKQHVASSENLILNQLPKSNTTTEKPLAEKNIDYAQFQEKKKKTVSLLNWIGIRFVGSIFGFLAALTLRFMSDSYYQPGDYSILSTIAELIANSDFIFVLLVLFAVAGSVGAVHYFDKYFEDVEMSIWLRYFLSLIAAYLAGALVVILCIFVIPPVIALFVALGAWVIQYLLPLLGGSGGSSSPPTSDKTKPTDEPSKSNKLESFETFAKSDHKDANRLRTLDEYAPKRKSTSRLRTLDEYMPQLKDTSEFRTLRTYKSDLRNKSNRPFGDSNNSQDDQNDGKE